MEKKFEVILVLDITCDGHGFSDYTLNYHGLSYDQMQKLQSTIVEALLALGDAGGSKRK